MFIIHDKQSWYLNKYAGITVIKTIHSWFKATKEYAASLPQLQQPNREETPRVTKKVTCKVQVRRVQGDGCQRTCFGLKWAVYLLIAVAAITSLFWLLTTPDPAVQNHLSTYKELVLHKICEIHGKMDACIQQNPELEQDVDHLKELVSKMANVSTEWGLKQHLAVHIDQQFYNENKLTPSYICSYQLILNSTINFSFCTTLYNYYYSDK